jgi:hypothetical protein
VPAAIKWISYCAPRWYVQQMRYAPCAPFDVLGRRQGIGPPTARLEDSSIFQGIRIRLSITKAFHPESQDAAALRAVLQFGTEHGHKHRFSWTWVIQKSLFILAAAQETLQRAGDVMCRYIHGRLWSTGGVVARFDSIQLAWGQSLIAGWDGGQMTRLLYIDRSAGKTMRL